MFFRMAHVASYNDPYFVFVLKILAVKFRVYSSAFPTNQKNFFSTSVAASNVRSRSGCVLTNPRSSFAAGS